MTITIIGTGYVGLTSAAILASAGYTVYALDIDEERLAIIRSGRSFFFEANLNPLIAAGIQAQTLIPTSSYKEAICQSDIIFSCVGTPDSPDGSSNLHYVFAAAEETAKQLNGRAAVYVQKSTVPVGTGQKIEQLFAKQHAAISYVSNPEFLREGTALLDSLWFDRVVVGSSNAAATDAVTALYKQVTAKREVIANIAGLSTPHNPAQGEYLTTSLNSAELIKVTANAFLATKITFANSIAKLADAAQADIKEVMRAVGADPRIGRSFLNAGRGYGGGCFPKDVSGLINSAADYGVDLPILHAVSTENESMPAYIIDKVTHIIGSLKGKRITVLGLAFKAGTSDVRKSPAIKIANLLADQSGAIVSVYDNIALEEQQTREDLHKDIKIITGDLTDAISKADAVFVATDWPEFTSHPASRYAKLMAGKVFVDCMNCFSPEAAKAAGLTYVGVGRS